ncbi:photoreceptor cilium actin regulator [Scomber scombrus]|uniref:Photoreceptor cilium actin regulator n=1 Tax=Scomber scombrus TaxID=13677 RepID=A0AAV1PTC2_SCOSC
MGCSPSKGKLFSKPESPLLQNALLAEASQVSVDSGPVEEDKTEDKEKNEPPLPTEDHITRETTWSEVALDTKAAQCAEDIKETEEAVILQETVNEVIQTDKIKKTEKRKKKKDKKRATQKLRKSSIAQTKVDFPPQMVRAHQAAFAFLNPNISKYETLLGLLDQAAQTQLSLQPMMSALVFRFEEINQALEEMAEEGELMMKEHGEYMALPSGMMGPAFMPAKHSTDTNNPPEPPPDLLQQLLKHSTEKMKLVGGSARTLGDTTLEEAADYFSSLSQLLVRKLQAKQAVEQRLTQVLARVEVAAMRKSYPEDSALHSEDSGIGGENESLTGSERHRRHRGSAGSGSCGSGVNIRDPSQSLLYMRAKYMQDLQHTYKRPLAAIKPDPSTKCVNIVMELQKSQSDLDQRMKKIQGKKELAVAHFNLYRAGLRRHSLSGSASAQKGPFKANKSPCSLPMLTPQPPRRQSVRRLINTFSQGVDGRPGQILANIPPHIRKPRKSGIHILSDIGNSNEGSLVINGNNNNNSWPDGRDDLDVDTLPPPPPEVLMDNSFQSNEGMPENGEGSQEESVRTLPMINQKAGVSQRLRASVQNVEVLPNRVNVRPRAISMSPTRPVRQDAVMGAQDAEQQQETDLDPDMQKTNCLYQQARKIIHLRNAVESSDKRNIAEQTGRRHSAIQNRMGSAYHHLVPLYATDFQPLLFTDLSHPLGPHLTKFSQDKSQDPQALTSRGRVTTRGTDNTTRRTQSEQRPRMTAHPEFSKDGNSTFTQAKQSEPGGTKERPVSPLMTEDDN